MNLPQLAALALPDLIARAKAGTLPRGGLWLAVRGATRYATAVAGGDIADGVTQALRLAQCQTCPHYTARREGVRTATMAAAVYHCGTPYVEDEGTCGCLVAVGGEAAGKLIVGSERCPSGQW